jgi:hypothetical protein
MLPIPQRGMGSMQGEGKKRTLEQKMYFLKLKKNQKRLNIWANETVSQNSQQSLNFQYLAIFL